MSLADHPRHRPPGARPAEARPPYGRDADRRARACCSRCSPGSSTAPATFDRIGAPLLGIFPFVVMFLVTSVATLRERTIGHPGAAAHDADRQARPAARLRASRSAWSPSCRRRGERPSRSRCSVSTWPVRSGCWCVVAVLDALLGMALGPVRQRVRGAPSSRPCSSCRRSCCRSSCSAGCSSPGTRWPTCCESVSDVLPLSYAVDAMSAHRQEEVEPGVLGRPSVVRLRDRAGARLWVPQTLRRRTP